MERRYEIHPILTCKLKLDKGVFTYFKNYGEKLLVPIWAWLILGDEKPILVDAGCSLEEFEKYSLLCSGGEEGVPIENSLQEFGISSSDVGAVVVTHLHGDHCLNAKKFSKAKVIVQKKELEFAMNPHPLFAAMYSKEWYRGLNFETIHGDKEILPGLKILATPGHTVGGQSVSIATQQGRVVIAGLCTLDENFSAEGDTIPGMHTDPIASYESMIKIRKAADTIIPLHSERMLEVKSIA